jgi:phage terminase large subunit
VHSLLKSIIFEHDLGEYFDVSYIGIKCKATDSEFVFAGLADQTVDGIKSLHGVTDVWVEEAQRLSRRSMDILLPTIRADNSEFFFSFNPELETDPVYKRFVSEYDPQDNAIVVQMNWSDNPWFPDVLKTEMESCKRRSHDDYMHIWEGKTRSFTKASILGHLVREQSFEPDSTWTPYYGIDWGYASSPTVCVRVYLHEKTIYLRNAFVGFGVEIDEYGTAFKCVPGADKHKLLADCARPECISFLNNPTNFEDRRPLNVEAAPKWQGSIDDGIIWLRSRDSIIIHPDCKEALEQIPKYLWKVDRVTGEILPIPVDAENDVVDAIRYALSRFIKKKFTSFDIL